MFYTEQFHRLDRHLASTSQKYKTGSSPFGCWRCKWRWRGLYWSCRTGRFDLASVDVIEDFFSTGFTHDTILDCKFNTGVHSVRIERKEGDVVGGCL
jgi:hypothetical protein